MLRSLARYHDIYKPWRYSLIRSALAGRRHLDNRTRFFSEAHNNASGLVYVQNLPTDAIDDIRSVAEEFGEVRSASLGRYFSLLEFAKADSARAFVESTKDSPLFIDDRPLHVSLQPRNIIRTREPTDTVFLGNLPTSVTADEILEAANKHGDCVDVRLNHDYAHVSFRDTSDAISMVKAFNDEPFVLHGKLVTVDYSDRSSVSAQSILRTPSRRIFVTGIPHDTNTERLDDFFSQFGPIIEVHVDPKRPQDAYIQFKDQTSANLLLERCREERLYIEGNTIAINYASPFRGRSIIEYNKRVSKVSPRREIYFGGLPPNMTEDGVWRLGTLYGHVEAVHLVLDRDENQRGFGHMIFRDVEAAKSFVDASLEEPILLGSRPLFVEYYDRDVSFPRKPNVNYPSSSLLIPNFVNPEAEVLGALKKHANSNIQDLKLWRYPTQSRTAEEQKWGLVQFPTRTAAIESFHALKRNLANLKPNVEVRYGSPRVALPDTRTESGSCEVYVDWESKPNSENTLKEFASKFGDVLGVKMAPHYGAIITFGDIDSALSLVELTTQTHYYWNEKLVQADFAGTVVSETRPKPTPTSTLYVTNYSRNAEELRRFLGALGISGDRAKIQLHTCGSPATSNTSWGFIEFDSTTEASQALERLKQSEQSKSFKFAYPRPPRYVGNYLQNHRAIFLNNLPLWTTQLQVEKLCMPFGNISALQMRASNDYYDIRRRMVKIVFENSESSKKLAEYINQEAPTIGGRHIRYECPPYALHKDTDENYGSLYITDIEQTDQTSIEQLVRSKSNGVLNISLYERRVNHGKILRFGLVSYGTIDEAAIALEALSKHLSVLGPWCAIRFANPRIPSRASSSPLKQQVFIGNLVAEASDQEILDIVQQFADVTTLRRPEQKTTGTQAVAISYCHVDVTTVRSAEALAEYCRQEPIFLRSFCIRVDVPFRQDDARQNLASARPTSILHLKRFRGTEVQLSEILGPYKNTIQEDNLAEQIDYKDIPFIRGYIRFRDVQIASQAFRDLRRAPNHSVDVMFSKALPRNK